MPSETPLECPDCRGYGMRLLSDASTVACDTCKGSAYRACMAGDCEAHAVTIYEVDGGGDTYPMCRACADQAAVEDAEREAERPYTRADFDRAPSGRCSSCKGSCAVLGVPSECFHCFSDRLSEQARSRVRDTTPCPAPDFGATG